jgi:hypothetical protein
MPCAKERNRTLGFALELYLGRHVQRIWAMIC